MKKFLMVVGGAAVVVLFLIVALVAVMAIKGRGLDKESQHYADASIVAIVTNWNEGALMDRASPEFIKACPAQCTAQLFSNAGSLGPLQHYLGSKGQANMSFWVGKGTIITAAYIARASFVRGPAEIRLDIVKRYGQWQILGFHVHMDQMPQATGAGST